jgi:hypothetical protein
MESTSRMHVFQLRRFAISTIVLCFMSACTITPLAPIESTGSVTTSAAKLALGQVASVTQFSSTDTVYFYVRLNWAEASASRGRQIIEWRWLQDEKVVFKAVSEYVLQSPPFDIRSSVQASKLGTGVFTVEARLAGKVLDRANFTITP